MRVDLVDLESEDDLIELLTRIVLLIKPLSDVNKVVESGILGDEVIY